MVQKTSGNYFHHNFKFPLLYFQ